METPRSINAYRPYWAKRFGTAPVLPMTRAEMDARGWDSCDIILVTGDAYIDHPSFGMALVGRLLEAQGFRVGIIAQPDWLSADAFKTLGKPNLYFGVTAGNMDSMVNRYTADRKIRSDDAYTPNAEAGKRPDRAVLVYSQRCREAYPDVPLVIGSIEASLRRIAHYDYWSDKVRRSILVDSKADILLYGNAERALVELSHRIARGDNIADITDIRGTAFLRKRIPEGWDEIASTNLDRPGKVDAHVDPYEMKMGAGSSCETDDKIDAKPALPEGVSAIQIVRKPKADRSKQVVRLPAYEEVIKDPVLYAHASRVLHLEANPGNARALVQRHGDREVWLNPPPIPLTTKEMDFVYDLPYARKPHPVYKDARIPAWEMIRFSVNIMRGCFGGCTFCSITEHEGRIIQSRSEESILNEIVEIRDKVEGFTGIISDLGGPTANMYRMACKSEKIEQSCRKLSCVYPGICENLNTDHSALIQLYRKARNIKGVKKILVGSGLRYDLAVTSPEYVKELVQHHVGGYLKIAPEHSEENVLSKMMKPGMGAYDKFKLVPFGEFTPFASLTKPLGIEALTHFDDSFTAGPRTRAVTFDHLPRLLPLICYEGIFPGLDTTNYRASTDTLRPRWIVNISNDAWFGPTTGPLQHLNLASYRAIEEGLPMVRSTPTGISAVIDPLGRVLTETRIGTGQRAYVDATVPNAVTLSPYAAGHCLFAIFCTIFCLILVAFDTCVLVIKKNRVRGEQVHLG